MIRIKAKDEKGQVLTPGFAYTQTEIEQVDAYSLRVQTTSRQEINVSFAQAVKHLELESELETELDFSPLLEISELHYIEAQEWIPNPALSKDCIPQHYIFALDRSASIGPGEYQSMQKGLQNLWQSWQSLEVDIYVSVIEFHRRASLALDQARLDRSSLSGGGEIAQYLQRLTAKKAPDEAWTNWESALELSQAQIQSSQSNALFFLTDGLPNGNHQQPLLAGASLG